MTALDLNSTVGELVTERPARSRVFEQLGIDYCCGGGKSLADACAEKRIQPTTVMRMLADADTGRDGDEVDAGAMSLTELCDHIEQTHHAYLRRELPRLDQMTEKVVQAHGEREPRMREIRRVFLDFIADLSSHMMKEEQILFPIIRTLERDETAPQSHCGSIANPIRQMELEHDSAGAALDQFRSLTDGYAPAEWACNTLRAMLDAMRELEADMHQHVHKENNVLFPRAVACAEPHVFTQDTYIGCDDFQWDDLDIIIDACTVTIDCTHSFNSVEIINGGKVTHSGHPSEILHLIVTEDMLIEAASGVDLHGKGYPGREGPGAGGSGAYGASGGGAAHGGGGNGTDQGALGGETYGVISSGRAVLSAASMHGELAMMR